MQGNNYRKIVSIQQQFTEQFQTLTSRYVVFRVQQPLIVCEHFVIVGFQEFRAQNFVTRQQFLVV